MRVMLEEQLDRRLKKHLDPKFDVWKKYGELLRAAQQEFDVLITMDKGIEHQQNWKVMALGFIIVSAKAIVMQMWRH